MTEPVSHTKTPTNASVQVDGLVSTVKLRSTHVTAALARMEEHAQVLTARINANVLKDGLERSVKMKLLRVIVIHVKMAAFASLGALPTNVSVQQNGLVTIATKCITRAAKILA
jgi:hypothetical protein